MGRRLMAPMRAEIFKITSPLQKNFYTNIDPKQYCNMQESMGAPIIQLITQVYPTPLETLMVTALM